MFRLKISAFLLAIAGVSIPAGARAHFILEAPPSWATLDTLGGPQKSAPCGQADPGQAASPTGIVTAFAPGETVTITINETVPHPGHYRVVLSATGQGGLPADPPVTAAGTDPCGSTVIQSPPVFPVLADGMLTHTGAFSAPQSFTVTLPTDVTCAKCTLQVAEFMSNHGLNNPGGCFYHHCADISIQQGGGNDAGAVEPGGSSSGSGCGCAVEQRRRAAARRRRRAAPPSSTRRASASRSATRLTRSRSRLKHEREAELDGCLGGRREAPALDDRTHAGADLGRPQGVVVDVDGRNRPGRRDREADDQLAGQRRPRLERAFVAGRDRLAPRPDLARDRVQIGAAPLDDGAVDLQA
jgi:hypothetical protein